MTLNISNPLVEYNNEFPEYSPLVGDRIIALSCAKLGGWYATESSVVSEDVSPDEPLEPELCWV